jgi:hypothetical protein
MDMHRVTLTVSAIVVAALGVVAVAQQKPAAPRAATPPVVVYKSPT